MELTSGPKILVFLGIALVVAGVIWHFVGPFINLGKLPGDIYIEKENYKFYFPLATSILVSIVISLILWLMRRS
jgi:hypothetical protein